MCIKNQQKTTKNNKKQQQQNMSTYVTKILEKLFYFFVL